MAIVTPNLPEPGCLNPRTFYARVEAHVREMLPAFLTIVQTSLLQQAKLSQTKGESRPDGVRESSASSKVAEQHLDVAGIHPDACNRQPEVTGDISALLRELVEVAQGLAQMDAMLMETRKTMTESRDAQKWQEVSLRALIWSREALAKRQVDVLARLKSRATKAPLVQSTSCCNDEVERMTTLTPVALSQNRLLAGSLRSDLEKLKAYDREQCLCVRNITKLGLSSQEKLQSYFKRYGEVSEVLVAHCFEKPSAKRRLGRVRPATKGFVVMKEPAAALAVLEAGEVHTVADGEQSREVIVQCFNPRAMDGLDEEA